MSLVSKKRDLTRKAVVPVFCDRCGNTGHLPRVDEDTSMALVGMGYYRQSLRELDLLQRTERLFARFPNSRHPLVVQHLHLEVRSTCDDEAFESALKEDSEVQEFLRMGFLLSKRLEVVQESVDEYAKRKRFGEFLVQCQACYMGSLCLEEKFFERLGHACA